MACSSPFGGLGGPTPQSVAVKQGDLPSGLQNCSESGEINSYLQKVKARSEERVARLEAIRPAGDAAAVEGNVHPLLTLELGIAFHQAMADVCKRFERASTRSRPV